MHVKIKTSLLISFLKVVCKFYISTYMYINDFSNRINFDCWKVSLSRNKNRPKRFFIREKGTTFFATVNFSGIVLLLHFLMYFSSGKPKMIMTVTLHWRKDCYVYEIKLIKSLLTSLRNRCQLCFDHLKINSWINNCELVFNYNWRFQRCEWGFYSLLQCINFFLSITLLI